MAGREDRCRRGCGPHALVAGAGDVQPRAGAELLGGDPHGVEGGGVDPAVPVLDDPLVDRVGDDQHQVGPGLGEADADHLGVEQAEGEDEILAGDAVGVPERCGCSVPGR